MTWMHPNLPHRVIIYHKDWDLAQAWCDENVGQFDLDWYKLGIDPMAAWAQGSVETVWFFQRESDAVAFALKWS